MFALDIPDFLPVPDSCSDETATAAFNLQFEGFGEWIENITYLITMDWLRSIEDYLY